MLVFFVNINKTVTLTDRQFNEYEVILTLCKLNRYRKKENKAEKIQPYSYPSIKTYLVKH